MDNNQTKKFFLYARKSTDEPERQILSIEAQLFELREFAKKENLNIVKEFVESKTAKEPGREIFNDMIAGVERHEAEGILAWHPDRLARNSIDGGRIIYLVDTGKIRELKFPTFWFDSTPQGKFMLSIAFGQSKYYVDNLSENIKRGIRQKLRNGIWPSWAPLGYINDKNKRCIVVDKKKEKLIKKAFEVYSTGEYPLSEIRKIINSLGLVGKKNKTLSVSNYQYMFKNPIYYGVIRYNGELYEGKHEPIITKKLFDKVQDTLKQKSRSKTKKLKYFLYRGFFKCGECGYTITADRKIKKSGKEYVYYYCTKKNPKHKCSQNSFTKEEKIFEQVKKEIKKVSLCSAWANKMIKEVEKEKEQKVQSQSFFAQKLKDQLSECEKKIDTLLDMMLNKAISQEEYLAKKQKLINQKMNILEKLSTFERKSANRFELMINFIKQANRAKNVALQKNHEQSRDFLKKIGSNFQIQEQKLILDFKNPWKIILKYNAEPCRGEANLVQNSCQNSESETWRCFLIDVRTFFDENPEN